MVSIIVCVHVCACVCKINRALLTVCVCVCVCVYRAVMESNARQVGTREAAQKLSSQQESFFSSLSKSASFLPLLQSKIR